MKKLVLFAIALGSLAVSCTPPTEICVNCTGHGDGGDGGSVSDGGSGQGGSGGAPTTSSASTGGSEPVQDAHWYYVNQVHPSVIQTCGGCHNPDGEVGAPAWLDYDPELSYPVTKAYPGVLTQPVDSILITKQVHEGPSLSDDQKALVGQWLVMELNEGGGAGGSGPTSSSSSGTMQKPTLEEMLDSFAKCMDYDVWVATGMDQFPLQQTNGDGACAGCHNEGAGANWLSLDPLETFQKNQTYPYIMRLVTPIYDGPDPVDLAPSNRLVNKGIEPCANPPICHPKYTLSDTNKQALEDFVGGTLTKWQSGACGP